MNTIVKFSDEIVGVSTYLLFGQQRKHVGQRKVSQRRVESYLTESSLVTFESRVQYSYFK